MEKYMDPHATRLQWQGNLRTRYGPGVYTTTEPDGWTTNVGVWYVNNVNVAVHTDQSLGTAQSRRTGTRYETSQL